MVPIQHKTKKLYLKNYLMKTIAISIYDGDTEKNILRSGVLDVLKKSDNKIILLIRGGVKNERVAYYEEHFQDDNVLIVPIPNALTTFERWMFHFCWNSLPTRSAYVKRHDLYLKHRNIFRYTLELTAGFLGKYRMWREIIRWFYFILPDNYAKDIFEKYKPDILFAPNMFSAEDCRLLRSARKMGIRTITMAKSWDVPTTRGFTRVKADSILVFNEINKQEIIDVGDYDAGCVHVVGFPQFDSYINQNLYSPRKDFFEQMGIQKDKELVLFAVPGDFKNPYSHEIMEQLDRAVEDGKFVRPVQFLARFHPKYPSKGEMLKNLKHFTLDRPGTYFSKTLERSVDAPSSETFQWTYTDKDILHLINSLHHSVVVVNTESTITLDAAAIDRPVVLVGFDGNQKLSYWNSIIRNYDREHLIEVLKTNGTRLSRDFEELVDNINAYLKDPKLDARGRELLRDRLLYRVDGKSSQRVAAQVLKMLN